MRQNAPVSGILPDLAGIKRQIRYLWYRTRPFTDIAVKVRMLIIGGATFTDFIVVSARVIFTQPVPFPMSACSSPTIGIRRLTSGRMDIANQVFATRIFRLTATPVSPNRVSGRVVANHQIIFTVCGFRAVSQRIADVPHRTFRFAVFHFRVRDSGAQFRIPFYRGVLPR